MPYDPRAPFHERYVKNPPAYDPALLDARRARLRCTLCRALGYDLNTVEFAVEDGVPYAIDFMNPAPDADLHSVGEANFEWIVERRRGARRAEGGGAARRRPSYRWAAILEGLTVRSMKPSFTHRDRGGVPDHRSGDLRPALAHRHRDHREGQAAAGRADQGRDAPGGGRGRHRRLPQHRRGAGRHRQSAPADGAPGAARTDCCSVAGATHPFADWRVQDIYPDERYLQVVEDMQLVARSNLIFGLHVHVGIEDRETAIHLMNQMRYFLPHLLALSTQLAVLARHEHRAEVVPLQGVRQVPAHQHPRHVLELGRVRELRQPAGPHQLHRQRQEDLVGRAAASVLLDARSPHLRHPDARGRDAGDRRADPGHRRQALQAALPQPGLPRCTAGR